MLFALLCVFGNLDELKMPLLLENGSENIDLREQIKELHHRQFRKSKKRSFDTKLNDKDYDKAWIINKLYYFSDFYLNSPERPPWIPSYTQIDVLYYIKGALFVIKGEIADLIFNVIHYYCNKIYMKPLIGDLVVYFIMKRPKSEEEAITFLNNIGLQNYAKYLPDNPEYYSGNSIYSPENKEVLPYLPPEWVSKFNTLILQQLYSESS
eukprot:NODE_259_length_11524_cov_0.251028.p4 type:complete len:209 gc:universal NODE_259_length_11524_cov_0.251028:10323-9697(-)